jgi:hypothetical protein
LKNFVELKKSTQYIFFELLFTFLLCCFSFHFFQRKKGSKKKSEKAKEDKNKKIVQKHNRKFFKNFLIFYRICEK